MCIRDRFRGGIAPYGYRLEASGVLNKRKHEVLKLTVVESEANVVRLIFQLCVNSGYGRCRIANFLNEGGITTKNGGSWHESTIGHMLHNVLYTGVLRSGNSKSEIIPELQIITPDIFQQAQVIMQVRTNANDAKRTLPRHTRGQSLLSGNIYCGHCGGRMYQTSNTTDYVRADGGITKRKRIRYVCYNRARKWNPCDGQTGYTTHILDAKVDAYLCELFDGIKQKGISTLIDEKSEQLETAENLLMETEHQLEKAQRQYDEMKSQLMNSLEAAEPSRLAIVMEVLDSAYEKIAVLKQQQADLQYQIEEMTEAIIEAEKNRERIMEWANIWSYVKI